MPAPKPEQRVGLVLDAKYELRRFIGSGASGAVYAAYHRYTEREVAVKILHAHLLDSRDHVARFLREARVAASISHPNVAAVVDAGRTESEGPYLVSDLLEGEELWDRMRKGNVSIDETFGIVEPLLRGLHAAHEKGVIHRDVKPENVFLANVAGEVVPKLIDFGIAKRPWSATSTVLTAADRTVGTPLYMAPEQIRGSFVDARTDVWAVGIMLHELIAGHPPFMDRDPLTLLTKIVKQRAPSVSERVGGLPAWVIRVADRALEPKPDDRWQTAAAMADAIIGR